MPKNSLYDFFSSAPSNALARAGGRPDVDLRRVTPQAVSNGLGAASMAMPSPYGDLAGLAADAIGYAGNPRSLTPLNGLLSIAALAPGIPRAGQAKVGGEIAESNGFFYKGGQFLPSTPESPGKYRVGKNLVKRGKTEIAPGSWEHPPTATAQSFFKLASPGAWSRLAGDKLEFVPGMKYQKGDGGPWLDVTPDMPVGPSGLTIQEAIDAYNSGHRWFDTG